MKKFSLIVCAIMLSLCAFAENVVTIPAVSAKAGETFDVAICLTTDVDITAFQMDVVVPEGFTLVEDEDEEDYVVPADGRFQKSHSTTTKLSGNTLRVVSYSGKNQNLKSNEGELFTIHVKTDNTAVGEYKIEVKNAIVTEYDATTKKETGHNLTDASGVITVDNPDGIESVEANASARVLYNLAGQRVSKANGLVINNGKIQFVK